MSIYLAVFILGGGTGLILMALLANAARLDREYDRIVSPDIPITVRSEVAQASGPQEAA